MRYVLIALLLSGCAALEEAMQPVERPPGSQQHATIDCLPSAYGGVDCWSTTYWHPYVPGSQGSFTEPMKRH